MTAFRLPAGGRIDRDRRLAFSFDGRPLSGFRGDTLATHIPGAKKVVIPNAGHGAHFAQPASFNSALMDFIYAVERNRKK